MSKPFVTYLGLKKEETDYKQSPVVIIPCPLERTTSYRKGTKKGPDAIIDASYQVEFFDTELEKESWKPGIHTLDPISLDGLDSAKALEKIESVYAQCLEGKKFPIALGGEHTLTGGTFAACAKYHKNLSILQIDAHADLRESYENTPYSHACAMRLVTKHTKNMVQVGIRSMDIEEHYFAKKNPGIKIFYDHNMRNDPRWIEKAIDALTENVYLTIDVDGFDPSLIPATGTPEPGGLSWYEGLSLIRACFQKKNVVGCDVVELCPMESHHASNFVVAKLVYKLIGYHYQFPKP